MSERASQPGTDGVRVPPVSALRAGNRFSWQQFSGSALVLLAAALATAPLLLRGPSCGHDFDFHLVSWLDAQQSWRSGILYPHWTPSANFGAGEPRFVFYPPLTWMLGAGLGFVLPWALVPAAITFLLLAGTGLATRALARVGLSNGAATLAGCAAIFSGYELFTAYERTAFGELAGGVWLPLVLLFALREDSPAPSRWKSLIAAALPLALVVSAAWLSNAPVGVMACYLLAAVSPAWALLRRSWMPILRAAVAAALGIGVSAFYLLPAAWQQRWVAIRQATSDPGERIENSWLFARHANPALAAHDVELHRVSWIAVSMIAIVLLGCLIAAMRGMVRAERIGSKGAKGAPVPPLLGTGESGFYFLFALIPVAILVLQLPVSLPLWNLLPKLRFLQFPWRWLVALEAPMGIFFAAAVWPRSAPRRWQRWAVVGCCAALFVAASYYVSQSFYQVCDDEDAVPAMLSIYRSGAGFVGTDEYAPVGADNTLVPTGLPDACLVKDPTAELATTTAQQVADSANPVYDSAHGACEAVYSFAEKQPESLRLTANLPQAGFLILRLRSYPAWQIVVNGRAVGEPQSREDGLIALPVAQGPLDLRMDWRATHDVLLGRAISIFALVLVTVLWLTSRKTSRSRLSSTG